MNFFDAVILGIIQGITEFLPISSTGHLTLAGRVMDLISAENPERWTSFIAVIQLGTLLAVLIYFRNDIWNISLEFLRENIFKPRKIKEQSLNSRLGWMIIIATIPIVIIGLLFKDQIEGAFTKNLYVISISLIVLAIILFIAERTAEHKKGLKQTTLFDSLIVGLAQAVALIPGSSRSGTTITGALFLGFKRETAARFSFLMSIPAVLASGALQFYEALDYINRDFVFDLTVATIAAALSGYLSIDLLLKYLRKNSTLVFIIYRICLGLVILIFLYFDVIQP